jgi:RNA polymerase sigma factor (sigma-70 family)
MERRTYDKNSTDACLREGCMEGNRVAQEYLYRRYFERLMPIPLRYIGQREEARDVLNQAFLKIFNNLYQYEQVGAFSGWMAAIVTHTTIDHLRRRSTYQKHISAAPVTDIPIANTAVDQMAVDDLLAMIQQLPESHRTVFNMYVIDGYKHREIADMLGMDEGTSKWYLSQARAILQKKLTNTFRLPAFLLL